VKKLSASPAEGGKGCERQNHEDDGEKAKTERYNETCTERKGHAGDIKLAI
jgi:hypothetical protein